MRDNMHIIQVYSNEICKNLPSDFETLTKVYTLTLTESIELYADYWTEKSWTKLISKFFFTDEIGSIVYKRIDGVIDWYLQVC